MLLKLGLIGVSTELPAKHRRGSKMFIVTNIMRLLIGDSIILCAILHESSKTALWEEAVRVIS
jgi:hypothetical protein